MPLPLVYNLLRFVPRVDYGVRNPNQIQIIFEKKPTTTRPRPWTMQPIGSLQAGALHTEKVLQQISEQVARLASAVSNISSALEERVTHADLSVASNKSDSNYSSVEERLARLERAVTVRASPGDHERAPVGLHVARLYAQLEATNQELAQRASSSAVASLETLLTERLNEYTREAAAVLMTINIFSTLQSYMNFLHGTLFLFLFFYKQFYRCRQKRTCLTRTNDKIRTST